MAEMTQEQEFVLLKALYNQLEGLQGVVKEDKELFFDIHDNDDIRHNPIISSIKSVCQRIEEEFPGMIQPFAVLGLESTFSFERFSFHIGKDIRSKLLPYLAEVLGILKAVNEHIASEQTKDIDADKKSFSLIKEETLRKIIERDYLEINRAYDAKCWKSVIILSGSAIEAILTDLLLKNRVTALKSPKAPRKGDITVWDLADIINVAVDTKLVPESVEKLSHSVREYRNLVHPGNEIRNKLKFDAEEARIALAVLDMVHRDLST